MRTNKCISRTIDESITECFELLKIAYSTGCSDMITQQRVAVTYLIELKEHLGLIDKSRMRWEKDFFELRCNAYKQSHFLTDI